MNYLNLIILPTPIKQSHSAHMDMEELKEQLYAMIDLKFSSEENESIRKRFSYHKRRYFGTVGPSFFRAQHKFIVGDFDSYFAITIEGDFCKNKESLLINLVFSLTKKSKIQLMFFTLVPMGFIFLVLHQNVINKMDFELTKIILPLVLVFIFQTISRFGLIRSKNIFLRDFMKIIKN